ncbi:MAG: adenylate/guanylate cyclase domain-containing protein [Anaerolineales bacterium]
MNNFPSGTVTFLFTDIEGSTQLWEKYPEQMRAALAQHDAILRDVIASHHGHIIKTTGDGVHAVFEKAIDAAHATIEAQNQLKQTSEVFETSEVYLHVRMGLHTGEAELRGDDYYGQALNRAARIMAVAHGGQILLSSVTTELIREQLSENTNLLDLGEHRLKDLSRPEHLYQLTAPGLRQEFPAVRTVNAFQTNLPVQLTSFIGREREIGEINPCSNSARLVTLTGSGGTGKSRLSIEIGKQESTSFPNGVWFVELAPLADPAQIIPTLAQVFGLQEHPFGPLPTLLMDYLRDKKLLLILDNCEHLIQACAKLANDLLHQCAALKILASSREALGIAGEMSYHIPSLADSESMRLFCERASAVNPNFHLTESNASYVAQICSRLDGIPLAIELAAARAKLLSPEQIASRLDDRFRLLVGGSRTALPRQQTLRALIDWSYDLLSEDEKRLFRTASVFVGGWTLDALEEVADDPNTLENLEQLVNKSLVVTEERESEMRYFMLETIRQYAREKLFEANQSSAARDRHFVYFDRLSETMWHAFRSEDALRYRDRADDEAENFRAAIEWGLEQHAEQVVHLAGYYCVIAGWINKQAEAIALVQTAVEKLKALPPVTGEAERRRKSIIAHARFTQGMTGLSLGNIQMVMQSLQEAIAFARETGDKLILGYSLEMYYVAANFMNVPNREESAREGYEIFTQEIEDSWGLSMAYQNMARLALIAGDNQKKDEYLSKLKEQVRNVPLSFQTGLFYMGLGMSESEAGNFDSAMHFFEDSMKIFKRLRNRNFENVVTSELGHLARRKGNTTQAQEIYTHTIIEWQNIGNRAALAHQLECFGYLALAEEEPQRALQLFGTAEVLREKAGSPMTAFEQDESNKAITRLRAMVAEPEFNTSWALGRSMTMEEAIEFALSK